MRKGRRDASLDRLPGHLALAPLADGQTAVLGGFAGQRKYRANLLRRELARRSAAGRVAQTLRRALRGAGAIGSPSCATGKAATPFRSRSRNRRRARQSAPAQPASGGVECARLSAVGSRRCSVVRSSGAAMRPAMLASIAWYDGDPMNRFASLDSRPLQANAAYSRTCRLPDSPIR